MTHHAADHESVHSKRLPRRDGVALLPLIIVLAATRAIVWSHPVPADGDEDRFAGGVLYLQSLASDQPAPPPRPGLPPPTRYPVHHPGYALWVGLGWLVSRLGMDPYLALRYLSCAASIIEPILFFAIARRFVSRPTALAAALAFGLAPVRWYYGVTSLNYVAGSAIGLTIVWLVLRATAAGHHQDASRANPGRTDLVLATVVCCVGMGVRPDILLWFSPLLLWACGRRFGALAGVGIALLVAMLAWGAVNRTLYASGEGVAAQSLEHTISRIMGSSVFAAGLTDGLLRNAVKVGVCWFWGAGLAAALLCLAAIPAGLRGMGRSMSSPRRFMVTWIAPPALFNLLLHMDQPGYTVWHHAV